ncbi:MAG TPA: HAD family acid phosphatase [Terracidiphilus sp.]|nr:HAD family acid phosphatase [Terracidiphilus sp.]
MKRILFAVAAILAFAPYGLAAQAQARSAGPVFSVDAAAERIPNFDALVSELKQYHDCTCQCGCYAHDLDTQADRAIAFLRRRAAQRTRNEKLAVVLDIDETSLSNYTEMLREGYVFNKQAFDAWADTAAAPAIPGTLRLDKEAARLGVPVFFITGRPDSERDATERNLRAQGFIWQQLTLRPASTKGETVIQFKSGARAQIAAQGYKIVLNVGDQWSDLKGAPEAEFSVKYPNPYYLIP